LVRLSLSEQQAERVRGTVADDLRLSAATRELLAECRRQLWEALATRAPDSTDVLELAVQERLLLDRQRQLTARVERSFATLLRPEQTRRLRALSPSALDAMLVRICG